MLGVVMLAAAVPTLPAVSYYLPPSKNTLAPDGQPPVAMDPPATVVLGKSK